MKTSRLVRSAASAAGFMLLLAGCGGSDQTPAATSSETAATDSATSSSSPTSAPSPTYSEPPLKLTTDSAKAVYLEIIDPLNEAGFRFQRALEKRAPLARIKRLARDCADLNDGALRGFLQVQWPDEVVAEVEAVQETLAAEQSAWDSMQQAKSRGELQEILDTQFTDRTSAQLLRAKLGLPRIPTG